MDSFDDSRLGRTPTEELRVAWEQCKIEAYLAAASRGLPNDNYLKLVERVERVKELIQCGEVDHAFEAIECLRDGLPGSLFHLQLGLEHAATSTAAFRSRYPHLASWRGTRGFAGASCGRGEITLAYHCSSGHSSHLTSYTVVKKQISSRHRGDIYQAWDSAIREWETQQAQEKIQRLARGWMGETDWKARYPHIASWVGRGKRHCIRIEFDLVDCKSSFKVWFYDSSSNTESVLIEKQMSSVSEEEVLSALDVAIGGSVQPERHREETNSMNQNPKADQEISFIQKIRNWLK